MQKYIEVLMSGNSLCLKQPQTFGSKTIGNKRGNFPSLQWMLETRIRLENPNQRFLLDFIPSHNTSGFSLFETTQTL